MDIQAISRDFPALEQYTWFQNGGVSITPVPVDAEYMRWNMVIKPLLHGRKGCRATCRDGRIFRKT